MSMDNSYVLVEEVEEDGTYGRAQTTLQLRGREREQEVMPFGHTSFQPTVHQKMVIHSNQWPKICSA